MKKLLLLMVAALVATFILFDVQQYLTLQGLKAGLSQFETWRVANPILIGSAFFLLYVLVTALSLPSSVILTLAAGALFGLFWGTMIASFASAIGATCAFLTSRYLLRETAERRYGSRLKIINEGIEKEGGFYLFTLRLIPIFPYFLINLLMGLTSISVFTFYAVSQVGMLVITMVYVNAGTQLAELEKISDILSPGLLLSLVFLGVFPLLAKKAINIIRARRVYKRWSRPKRYDRNLIVIGAGAGGLVTAYIAAAVKAKVTLIEAHKMGGDCLNYGCVPSKALIKSAKLAHEIRHAQRFGLNETELRFSFKKVMQRIKNIISMIEPHDSVERYTKLGVEVLQGYARLVDPWTVEVSLNDGTSLKLTSRSIVIATGARPFIPPLPGIDDVGYVTSDTLWDEFEKLDEAPKRLLVLGGGPIGCELAQCFARLGSVVTQVERGSRIMRREDEEVSALIKARMEEDGVQVLTEHNALRCERQGNKKFMLLESNGTETRIEFDVLLCAVGRVARLEGYGLETLGIETNRTLVTNEYLETLYPNIYAAGDITGPYQFTHVAAHQAWYAAVNALFGSFKKFKVDYSVIPWVTFVDPEVARVGLNEQEAKEKGIAYELVRYDLAELDRAITESTAYGFVKVLTVPGKDRILGVTLVGSHAGELLAEFVLAMKHGLGLNKILGTIHTYPTWSEANKYAAGEWKRAHAPKTLLRWVEKYHAWRRK